MFTRWLICCRQNCNCQSLKEPQSSITFYKRPTTGSISITYNQRISTSFTRHWNLVRDYVSYLFGIQSNFHKIRRLHFWGCGKLLNHVEPPVTNLTTMRSKSLPPNLHSIENAKLAEIQLASDHLILDQVLWSTHVWSDIRWSRY